MPKPAFDRTLDRVNSDVVLIVDDVPDNLAVLYDARLMWQTSLARDLLMRYCGTDAPITPIPVLT